jgi:hypothetical protein
MTCLLLFEKRKNTHHSVLPIAYKEGFHQRMQMITPDQGETVFARAAGISAKAFGLSGPSPL